MKDLIICFLIILYSFFVLNIYINKDIPIIDSAIFQYIAKMMILEGAVPFRDIFDQKPPLIDFINAVGFYFSNLEPWGVWLMEYISLGSAIFISYFLFNKIFGRIPAVIATLFWLLSFFPLIEGGNLTEEFAIPLQFAGILLFYLSEKKPKKIWLNLLLGICFGLILMLRQNLVGIFIGVYAYKFFISLYRKNFLFFVKSVIYFVIGILIALLPIFYYFWINNALFDFINFAFIYNYYYSGGSGIFSNFANVVYTGFKTLMTTFIWVFALIAFFDLFVFLIYKLKRNYLKDKHFILWFLLIILPIELLFSSTSGRLATHYYLAWLPVMSVLMAYLIFLLLNEKLIFKNRQSSKVIFILIGAVLLFNIIAIPKLGETYLTSRFNFPEKTMVEYLKQNTSKDDLIFVWGVGQHINVAANRVSSTKYVYQSPLYIPGFQQPYMYDEMLIEFKEKKPRWVVDGTTDKSRFKPINCHNPSYPIDKESTFRPLPQIDQIIVYICNNYQLDDKRYNDWRLYKLKN